MTWTITRNDLTNIELLNIESLFSIGNGYLGVRGNFEEGYGDDMSSVRGTYINAFHDVTKITYGEKLYAFPETQQKLLNIIDSQTIYIYLGEGDDRELFSLFDGEILSYERMLHLDRGFTERKVHFLTPKGKEIKLLFRRFVSFAIKELFVIDIQIEPVNFTGKVELGSIINGDVANYTNPKDPRVSAGHAKRLTVEQVKQKDIYSYIEVKTMESNLSSSCLTSHHLNTDYKEKIHTREKSIEVVYTFDLCKPVQLTKYNVYTDTLRHENDLFQAGLKIHNGIIEENVISLMEQQKQYLDNFWSTADVQIHGDDHVQEGIRFNLYHLLQSAGRDQKSNIAAKGLSGEGYEGHYFWDTEIYLNPVFIMTHPEIAKNLLLYRYYILDGARARAREMGHSKGALFPWRTIAGTECSPFFPAGTAQYHISADIAYSFIQYYLATNDFDFLKKYGAELLIETARLWIDTGHYDQGAFKIDEVTGPDEYTCLVNNNYYTNVMAKHNLSWAFKAYDLLSKQSQDTFHELKQRLQVTNEEVLEWKKIADDMYLPYDEKLGINPQDDTFLHKAIWDFENTPREKYPLLLHYHPLTLYRYQVCKQADTVLAHFLLEDEQHFDTIQRSYDYYEKVTTHDSSLSYAVFSIMAAKIGYADKAYRYFIETARLDLDNTHGNTKDGLHMANMGGTWMAIVFGFAGLRLKEEGISLAPSLPVNWSGYEFNIKYIEQVIHIKIHVDQITLTLNKGDHVAVRVYDQIVKLSPNQSFHVPLLT
ncbi:glycoside hydrolase family 65 protein [Anaerobacillus alkaliphilus]|uniref:Glycoside hydrolase family 65 protein n=1 Tax=Anaerobacillus alkaliphilus TaxID=1548597 RepID=A0A4Q0VVU5_9BACI|nr:glycosyl hydrolase family 65 protein [Anaerobacillus alkaliphilus]RXJ01341.1 glycoside hydrolase family 65 protein [Anaerobacillus alkaliphilus]